MSISKQIKTVTEVQISPPEGLSSLVSKPKLFKKAVDHSTGDTKTLNFIQESGGKSENRGVFGDKQIESIPEYISSPCEHIIKNEAGSFIVLGRDRPKDRTSGYSGKGDTQCASVDIVVGRLGSRARKTNEQNEQMYVDPSFELDAGRIYISQKTDIDDNFSLVSGKVGNSKIRSAIALKADGIRIIAREGIKLVTGVDRINSQGGEIRSVYGIDLIAGNNDKGIQPIPLGDNLRAALEKLTGLVENLSGIVTNFLEIQGEFNAQIAGHFHNSSFFGLPTIPSQVLVPAGALASFQMLTKVMGNLIKLKANVAGFKTNYLSQHGGKYINSRWNNTN